jgi:hypothetical protein
MMRRTGSKPEYGDFAAEFSPLGPGHYMVEPEGIGVWVDIELTGLEVVWIDFRRKSVPSSPNLVQPLPRQSAAPAPPLTSQEAEAPAEAWDESGFAAEGDADGEEEPTFDDESAASFDAAAEPESGFESLDSSAEEPSWPSSLATSSALDLRLPSLTTGEEDDDDDDSGDDTGTDSADDEAEDHGEAGGFEEEIEDAPRPPLTLLIPTPVTDVEDLAALLRFVKTTQSTMARTVDEVPDGSRVLLIGTVGTEEWAEVEGQLALRGLSFEKVTRKLSEALADDSLSSL